MKKQLGYKILRYGLIALVVLMPFHAFFTTWLGANTGHLLAVRAWKEVLLAVLTGIGLFYFLTDTKLRKILLSRTINKFILAYGVWLLLVSSLHAQPVAALAQGLAIDFRFLVIFVLFQVVLFYQPISRDLLYKIILIPAFSVVAFGLLQVLALPRDFLTHFGYNKHTTIPPFFTVDEQLTNLRYASTLSGPNTLGAYLVLPLMVAVGSWQLAVRKKRQLAVICYLLSATLLLYATQSRSAWLAALVSLGVYVLLSVSKKWQMLLLVAGLVGLVVTSFGIYHYQHTQFVQDAILHDDPTEGGAVSSNLGHIEALKSGLDDVAEQPLAGCGVGCAGPASVRAGQPKIAENYYLQIAEESGVVGLGLLTTLMILVGKELYKKRADSLALAVFASLVGLAVCNLLLHTWADDTMALVWWSVAAVTLYSKLDNTKAKSDLNPI